MNIALIAHDAKKELMVQFCIAYCGVLSRHNLCATGTTGKRYQEQPDLKSNVFLSGAQGGDQQIASRIACNEIDMLLFFRDSLTPKPHEQAICIYYAYVMRTIFHLQRILQQVKFLFMVWNVEI